MIKSKKNNVTPAKAGVQLMENLFTGSRIKSGMTILLLLMCFPILVNGEWLEGLTQEDEQARQTKLREFLTAEDDVINEIVPELAQKLADTDHIKQERIIYAFGRLKSRAHHATPYLIPFIDSKDYKIKLKSIETLGKIKTPPDIILKKLQPLLLDPAQDDGIRVAAINSVGELGQHGRDASKDLIKVIKTSPWQLRGPAVRALGNFGGLSKKEIIIVLRRLSDEKPLVRRHAKDALIKMGNPTLPFLKKALKKAVKKGNHIQRANIIDVLKGINTRQANEVLEYHKI